MDSTTPHESLSTTGQTDGHARRPRRGAWALAALVVLVLVVVVVLVTRGRDDPDRLGESAVRSVRAGSWEDAEASLARLARLGPLTSAQWKMRAEVARARGRPDEALSFLEKIPDGDPIAAQARLLAGQIELRRRHMPAAERLLRAAIALDPKQVQAHRELVYLYGMQLRRADLDAEFRALGRLTPLTRKDAFLWCLSRAVEWRADENVADLSKFLAADPSDRWSRLALAQAYRRLGRLDESEKVLAPLPDSDAEARAARAQIALDRRDERTAKALVEGGPADHPALARLRGQMALARRDGPAAVASFRAADAAEPNERATLFGLNTALRMIGEAAAAQSALKAAQAIDAVENLTQRAATPAGQADPSLPRQLGAACQAAGLIPQARAWYQIAISADPLDAEAQRALYALQASDGRGNRALMSDQERIPPD